MLEVTKLENTLKKNEIEKDGLDNKIMYFQEKIMDYNVKIEAIMVKIQELNRKIQYYSEE